MTIGLVFVGVKTMYLLLFFVAALILDNSRYECGRMLKIIPGVPKLTYIYAPYIDGVIFNVRRYGRKSEYYVNLEFTLKYDLGNNVSVAFIFYEYLHNEYRRSFVEMHATLCHYILEDELVGYIVRKTGITTCPMKAGTYRMHNMSFDHAFPNVFPFEKGKGELVATFLPTGKVIAQGDLGITFKQRVV